MKKLTAILLALASAIAARANTFTFSNTSSTIKSLSHGTAYTWGLSGGIGSQYDLLQQALHAGHEVVTGAALTIYHIDDWRVEPKDVLYVNILNGVATNTHYYTYQSNPSTYDTVYGPDAFVSSSPEYSNVHSHLSFAPAVADSLLVYPQGAGWYNTVGNPGTWSDPDTAGASTNFDLVVNFTSANLGVLSNFLNADYGTPNHLGLGFDPNCHYYDYGVCLKITTGPQVPDSGATMIMLGAGLLALCVAAMFVRRNQSKA